MLRPPLSAQTCISETNKDKKLELWVKSQKDTPSPNLLIICYEIVQTGIILFHAHPHVLYCDYVNFHQFSFICKGEVVLRNV